MQFHKDVLDTGLTVLRVPMDSVKSVTVLALVKVGSRYEDPRVSGVSHFLEHMVFKGTEKYPTAQDVAAAVDAVGAEFNAFTSKEYTGYYVKSASKDIELALDVVSDMLLTPQLRDEDLQREKGVIIEEINMYKDMPMRHIGDVFEQMFYAGSPLGRDIIGTPETVSNMQRQDFVSHLQTWYGLHNMVLIVVGDAQVLHQESLLTQIMGYFAKGDASQRKKPAKLKLESEPIARGKRVVIAEKKTEQAHFILGFPGLARNDADRYATSVLSTILGGNMSSRLFTEVREKRGLCYYVRSDVDMYSETGFFGAAAGVDPQRVEEAITVTFEQFTNLSSGAQPVTQQELERAKNCTLGNLILSMEDSQNVAQSYGMSQLLLGEVRTIEQIMEHISSVTMDDVERVVTRLIQPDQVRLAMIGPFDDEQKFGQMLGIAA